MQKLMKAMHKSEKGFTLVELMVVVVIIAVLVAIAIPIYQGIQRTAAESAHDANVRTLKGSGAIWYAEWGGGDGWVLMSNGDYYYKLDAGGTAVGPTGTASEDEQSSYFGNYIEGAETPTVPSLLHDSIDWTDTTLPHYHVEVNALGTVDVIPGIGAYDHE